MWLNQFFILRCKLRSKSPGAGGLWLWTSKEKLGVAVTLTAMDLWCHTPVLQTSPPEDRWPSTSPRGWAQCLWTGTGTSPGTWRTALSLRTLYLPRDRSFTFLTRSTLLIHGPARTRSPHLWWRRRGRQSCDLQAAAYGDENWGGKKNHETVPGWSERDGCMHQHCQFFLLWIEPEHCRMMKLMAKRVYHFCELGRLYLRDGDPHSCGKYCQLFYQPPATVNV